MKKTAILLLSSIILCSLFQGCLISSKITRGDQPTYALRGASATVGEYLDSIEEESSFTIVRTEGIDYERTIKIKIKSQKSWEDVLAQLASIAGFSIEKSDDDKFSIKQNAT